MKYQFLSRAEEGYVPYDKLYEITQDRSSYGFLTEMNRYSEKRLNIPELNDGFTEVFWYGKEHITKLGVDGNGVFVDYLGQGRLPLTFVCDVPKEGNYIVRVKIKAARPVEDAMIFTGRRRLAFIGDLKAGQVFEGEFLTNICPIIPRGYEEAFEDLTLDVTLIGEKLHLQSIEIEEADVPTMYIAGDSTVTDQSAAYPYLPEQSYCAWGQMISYYVGTQMAVSNHAHSGLTTESFRSEGHYDILINRIKKGDICLFQFGHNDQKLMELMAEGGYRERLSAYVNEIKGKGATPVIISPLARNSWKNNKDQIEYNDLLAPYQAECKRLAEELSVAYVELHDKAMKFVIDKGRDNAKGYFFPSDYTHSDDYGAFLFAGYVYDELSRNGLVEKKRLVDWPAPSTIRELVIPEEYKDIKPDDAVALLSNIERPEENLTRVEAMDFIIQTCKFFPTNVYNDMFTDIVGHETYAGTVETAYQNGMIPAEMTKDGKFYPTKEISYGEFIVSLLHGYSARKALTSSDMIEEAKSLGIIEGGEDLKTSIKRCMAADICRRINV